MTAEDGSVAIIVGLLLVVLVGVGALVIDVGNLYWERRQLQNAADAAALATAQEIVLTGTDSGALAVARDFADQNNSRGAHVAAPDLELTATTVRVTAQTGSIDRPGQLQSFLAGVLGVDEYATRATAAVSLDQIPGGGRTIPITICDENWRWWTENGTKFPSGTDTNPNVISFGGNKGQQDKFPENAICGNPGADFGQTYPGGFGFLQRDADCYATSNANDNFPGITGDNLVDPNSACSAQGVADLLKRMIDNNEEALIPIFDGFEGQGNSGEFEVIGYAGFRLMGYKFVSQGGLDQNSNPYPASPPVGNNWNSLCPNPMNCLVGYYTRFVALGADIITGGNPEDFGARIVGFIE